MASSLKKNDCITLKTESLLGNGNGLCRTDEGFVVFVPGTAPGDIVKAHVIKVTKNYAVAKILEIVQPSPYRNEDGCPFAKSCGGCTFQHISYEEECRFKENTVNDALSRIGGLDIRVEKFHGAKSVIGYRNKAVYPIGTDKFGKAISSFYAQNSHRIVQHDSCLISNPDFVKIRDSVIEFINKNSLSVYDEVSGKGVFRSIFLRSARSGDVSVTLIVNDNPKEIRPWHDELSRELAASFDNIKTIALNYNTKSTNVILGEECKNLIGDGYIYDELCGKKFRIHLKSFWQVNIEQAELLYGIAKEFASLKDEEVLADLYCGTGSVGISIADNSTRLFGVEIVDAAARDAEFNAKLNGIDGKFVALPAENALDHDYLKNLHPDVITVDPPRRGCVDAVEKIASLGAKRIIYISCDPATLARDLKEFDALGYKAVKVQAVDMFPRTGHVECCVLLCRT